MFKVRVERLLNKNIESVFNALTDHANYRNFPGISQSSILEQSEQETGGVGTLRLIVGGNIKLFERITGFDRPYRMTYQIEKAQPFAMSHEKGDIQLSEEDGGTRVVWVSEGRFTTPVIGGLIGRISQDKIGRIFGAILKAIDQA